MHPLNGVTSNSLSNLVRFPNGTWVENIALRWNGNLLVTLFTPPEVWEIDPSALTQTNGSKLVHHFPGAESVTGIAETEPDVFMVVSDNTIYKFDFTSRRNVSITEVVHIDEAGLMNGIASLDGPGGTVLAADAHLGQVWGIDTKTGKYEVVLEDDTMSPNDDLGQLLGVNGVRRSGGYLYYNNSPRRLLCRVRISATTGRAIGPYEIIMQGALSDDFAVSPDGTVYLAGLNDNVITRVWPDGTQETVTGHLGSTDVAGATSAAFGRTPWDIRTLYVTTSGASASPVNGTYVEGGKVVAIHL